MRDDDQSLVCCTTNRLVQISISVSVVLNLWCYLPSIDNHWCACHCHTSRSTCTANSALDTLCLGHCIQCFGKKIGVFVRTALLYTFTVPCTEVWLFPPTLTLKLRLLMRHLDSIYLKMDGCLSVASLCFWKQSDRCSPQFSSHPTNLPCMLDSYKFVTGIGVPVACCHLLHTADRKSCFEHQQQFGSLVHQLCIYC